MPGAREKIANLSNVSRETIERLDAFETLLRKWTQRINLIAPRALPDLWERHLLDSAQLLTFFPKQFGTYVDLGSGGGFPGVPLAILMREASPEVTTTLIESDSRKAVFLRTAARELDVNCLVLNDRIERAPPQAADIVTARALAPLPKLLGFVDRHIGSSGTAILQKGASWELEVEEALVNWSFRVQKKKSVTDSQAVVLVITELERR